MIKAVLFDFFGVLYPDTFWGLANIYLPERTDEMQQKLHELVRKADTNIIDQADFWQEAATLFGVTIDQLEKDKDSFGGVDSVLIQKIRELKEQGLKIGIISNVGSGMVSVALGSNTKLFDVLILSGDIGYIKPDPQVYIIATEKLSLEPSECLFFDDIPRNVRGAEAIGMNAALYSGIHDYKRVIRELLPNVNH